MICSGRAFLGLTDTKTYPVLFVVVFPESLGLLE